MELIIGLIVLAVVGYWLYVSNTSKKEAGVKLEQADATPAAEVKPAPAVDLKPVAVSVAHVAQDAAPTKTAKKKPAAKTAAKKTAAKKTAKPKAK
jgi:cytoskeletal protein RodZ